MSSTDWLEKTIVIQASRARVWRALTDSKEFGIWFMVELEGPFEEGQSVSGRLTLPKYNNLTLTMVVDQLRAEEYFSYRWHPNAGDPEVDYSKEPMTLVEFHLEDIPEGTRLTVRESGFDQIPVERRNEALRMNNYGWEVQLKNIQRHVDD